jgi:mono/diheme cytochrome c family protein
MPDAWYQFPAGRGPAGTREISRHSAPLLNKCELTPTPSMLVRSGLPFTMRRMILTYFVGSAILAAQLPVLAQSVDGDPAFGRKVATTLCSSCHRVMPMTLSDKGDPPSFQSIADLPSTTRISLNVFFHSNHNNMPDFILSSTESNNLIAYILSLKKH